MKNYVVESYENYKEENRLTTNNARKIEFITTSKILREHIKENSKILDCAAGTGIYAFDLAEQGHNVTATDITPRHIEIINDIQKNKSYHISTAVLDATNMNCFEDNSFDVVLNMGPFYHLISEKSRLQCIAECMRVLKKDGLLITAYIPRFYVFQYVAFSDSKYLDTKLSEQIIKTGVLNHDDEKCFWTDTYYSTKTEMEALYTNNGLEVIDHFAQDGLTPMLADKVDKWSENEFEIWCNHHYSVCREESTLGASNHVVIVGKK